MSEVSKSFTQEKYVVTYAVEHTQEGWRLDQFIQECMPTLSRQYLKKKIEKGEVVIAGRRPPHKPSVKVHAREHITITTHNDGIIDEEFWQGKPIERTEEPSIVYEDPNLVVINKPPFMLTHPAGKNLFYCANVWYESKFNRPVHTIHRIDRETTGLLLLAKNPKTAGQVINLFEQDQVRKCYFFIAHKNDFASPMPFTAMERMDKDGTRIPEGMISFWPKDSSLGKEAETKFELLLEKNNFILGLAYPVTGRQHQIRVHASAHGYPLLGDKLYNGDSKVFVRFKDAKATDQDHELMQIPRQALHAVGIKLPYPAGLCSTFVAPIPQDLADWIKLKLDLNIEVINQQIDQRIKVFFKESK